MKGAYFDCQFGASGDMLLGALLSAGLNETRWLQEMAKIALPPESFTIKIRKVVRSSIAATKVDVVDSSGRDLDAGACGSHHPHDHSHEYSSTRTLSDVLSIINQSDISSGAKKLAGSVFQRLARAESKAHGIDIDKVHFHEVGAIDAIVDIVGFAVAYELLSLESSYVCALPLGQGTIQTAHGTLALPAPAVVNLLAEVNAPTTNSTIDFECLTPTGAAILCEIASGWGQQPAFSAISAAGYGAGTKDPAGWPNACRVILGEMDQEVQMPPKSSRFTSQTVAVIETNLDDFSPQALSWVAERLLDAGALDVAVVPVMMKKGRSGHLLSVIAQVADCRKIQELVLTETTSLGVRCHLVERLVTQRQWCDVTLAHGATVRIKVALDCAGNIVNAQPEYDDCVKYATTYGVPLKEVFSESMVCYQNQNRL